MDNNFNKGKNNFKMKRDEGINNIDLPNNNRELWLLKKYSKILTKFPLILILQDNHETKTNLNWNQLCQKIETLNMEKNYEILFRNKDKDKEKENNSTISYSSYRFSVDPNNLLRLYDTQAINNVKIFLIALKYSRLILSNKENELFKFQNKSTNDLCTEWSNKIDITSASASATTSATTIDAKREKRKDEEELANQDSITASLSHEKGLKIICISREMLSNNNENSDSFSNLLKALSDFKFRTKLVRLSLNLLSNNGLLQSLENSTNEIQTIEQDYYNTLLSYNKSRETYEKNYLTKIGELGLTKVVKSMDSEYAYLMHENIF
ncbi:hypothetical protein PACTADRAFT_35083 [Pachysolen tannophilus NRRL Y-2460]|uniref:Uncharacterized protein n=1 Tax=Pachysolen tannophilus NRRL Y-2460 TaxID=669874 RepID=A0A1E4TRC5_PACTA|nr:hypothetical protein PACTADRAFT_35083 [Pachysolen tannophilus NRRL Y-2460]